MSNHYTEDLMENLYEKALDMGMSEAEALAYVQKEMDARE